MRTFVAFWLFTVLAYGAQAQVPYERLLDGELDEGNWLTYSGNYAGYRYSTLDDITPENVKDLRIAWMYQLKDGGRVTRGWLGVTIQNIDKNLAESFGLDRPQGALISQLAPGGPAQKSGLKAGDVIIEFDGKSVQDSAHLPHIVGLMEPGTSVPVLIIRDRKEKTVEVEVGGLDADDSYALSNRRADSSYGGRLGLITEGVPEVVRERLGINGGVVVRKVVSGSVAAQAGIIPGDVITYLGSAPISSTDALEAAVNNLKPGVSVPVRLIRRGSPLFIGLRLED